MKSYDELTVKSISEMVVPKQFQAIAHIISSLSHNKIDELLLSEISEFVNSSPNNFNTFIYLLNDFTEQFPGRTSYMKIFEYLKVEYKCHYVIYKPSSVEYLIALDMFDDFVLKVEKESIDIDKDSYGLSLIDIACKNGSEKCFSYLKLQGAAIYDQTFSYAIMGGNKNIILSLYNDYDFEITDELLSDALECHHNDIFDWLLETKGSIGELNTAKCFEYGNIAGLLFLIENGYDINMTYIIQTLFIIPILNSSNLFVHHYFKTFISIIIHSSITFVYRFNKRLHSQLPLR